MSVDRDEMLKLLKRLPEETLSELIFNFRLDAEIAENLPSSRRARNLIQHVEVRGPDEWKRLESSVVPRQPAEEPKSNVPVQDSSSASNLELTASECLLVRGWGKPPAAANEWGLPLKQGLGNVAASVRDCPLNLIDNRPLLFDTAHE